VLSRNYEVGSVGVGTGLYMYNVVVKKFVFAIVSPDEFLVCTRAIYVSLQIWGSEYRQKSVEILVKLSGKTRTVSSLSLFQVFIAE